MNRACAYCYYAILIPASYGRESHLYCSDKGEQTTAEDSCHSWQHIGSCDQCRHKKTEASYRFDMQTRVSSGPHYRDYCDLGGTLKVCRQYDPKPKDTFIEDLFFPDAPKIRLIRE